MTEPLQPPATGRSRIESIDLLRGLVMVLMLLDHTRDFVHSGAMRSDPLALETTTPLLYFTRWITHFCAPTFVFLAGVSAQLQLQRGVAKRDLSRFLVTRGLFLIAVELIVLRPAMWFQFDFSRWAQLQVIWVLGCSMIALAALIHAPQWLIAAFGLVQVLLHNAFDAVLVARPARTFGEALWSVLHQRNSIQLGGPHGPVASVLYPLVPWMGVMALGFVAGSVFELDAPRRRALLARAGCAAIVIFAVLRGTNLYGDPRPWHAQSTIWRSLLDFLNTEKYPPSLAYLAMTLGPALLALAALDGRKVVRLARPLLTFGRVPLFFYVLQWPTVHLVSALFRRLDPDPRSSGGFGLPAVYLGWALGLIALYPLCAWFAALKRRRSDAWLSYL